MYETNSFVGQVNPSVKLILHLLCMILIVLASEPLTTLYLLLIPVILTLTLAKIPLRTFVRRVSPFLIIFLSTTWVLAAYGKGETVWWEWAWIRITEEGVINGLNIGLRMMAFVCYGFLFTATTDLTKLVMSLMQQCKLSPKIAYALLAGFRFLPLFKEEYALIKAAHRVRGVSRLPGLRGKVQGIVRDTIPLLAQGIRKAERVAVALEARGFDGTLNRTFYHQMTVGRQDVFYVALLLLTNVAVLFLL
ncbi:energy-coupling factor transporter transmembrane component T family protein [Tumebacillus algifaecis]|nr:energy-coupling factor transporter transmembrane component T [Tumebacillus algifaecis]